MYMYIYISICWVKEESKITSLVSLTWNLSITINFQLESVGNEEIIM